MTRHRTTDKNIIFIRKYFYNFQTFQFYTVATHAACHAHTFHYTAGIRGVTQRTRSTLAVMLAMRLLTYPMEP